MRMCTTGSILLYLTQRLLVSIAIPVVDLLNRSHT
jgi:hypothetical protein